MQDYWSRIDLIFNDALDMPKASRHRYLEEVCEGNEMLRQEVEGLLLAFEQSNGLLEQGVPDEIVALIPKVIEALDRVPKQIGPFSIRKKIGEGGMAIVLLAEQTDPKRQVALKMLKPGLHTREVVARFVSERHMLAQINHPNVAQIYDVGIEDGKPYFTMEYVDDGEPIQQYCEKHNLSIENRIQLVIQVCEGVHAAHQKGIIHRDLTPANVLAFNANGTHWAKVIDFGIGKATKKAHMDSLILHKTRTDMIMGTPIYMSPEQTSITGLGMDTRTDVYGIGTILYRLLTGRPPFKSDRFNQLAFDEIVSIIRHEEPPKPSRIVNTTGQKRTSQKLTIQRELDWIVAKTLAKEKHRRYDSVSALAKDLRNFLERKPVDAGPISRIYRLKKTIQRNYIATVGLGVGTVALLVGILFSVLALIRAENARIEAENRASQLTTTVRFLQDMFRSPSPWDQGLDIKVRDLISPWASAIDHEFPNSPLIRARLHQTVGETYTGFGDLPKAEHHLQKSAEIFENQFAASHPERLANMCKVADLWRAKYQFDRAMSTYYVILDSFKNETSIRHPIHLLALRGIANTLFEKTHYEDAASVFEDIQACLDQSIDAYQRERSTNHLSLALTYQQIDRLDESRSLFERALADFEIMFGPEHPYCLNARNGLANLLLRIGKFKEAEELLRDLLSMRERVFGVDHYQTAQVMNQLGRALMNQGMFTEAQQYQERALMIYRDQLPSGNPRIFKAIHNLALTVRKNGDNESAAQLLEEMITQFKDDLDETDQNRLKSLQLLANIYSDLGRNEASNLLYHSILASRIKKHGESHLYVLNTRFNYALSFERMNQYRQAIAVLEPAYNVLKHRQQTDATSNRIKTYFGTLLLIDRQFSRAEPVLLEAFETARVHHHKHVDRIANRLVELYTKTGQFEKAERFADPP